MSTTTVEYDPVNKPKHYNDHPSLVECIRVTRAMSFDLGNAFKYVFRHGDKGKPIEDLNKARWYLKDAHDHQLGSVYPSVVEANLLAVSVLVGRIIATEPNPAIAKALELIWEAEIKRSSIAATKAANVILSEIERLEASDV